MARVFHTSHPTVPVFEGTNEEAAVFMAANEPRPHVADGEAVPQLSVEGDAPAEDNANEEE